MIAITRTPRRYARPHGPVRRDHQGEVFAGTAFRASRSTSAGFHCDVTPATSSSTVRGELTTHRAPDPATPPPTISGPRRHHTAQSDDEAPLGREPYRDVIGRYNSTCPAAPLRRLHSAELPASPHRFDRLRGHHTFCEVGRELAATTGVSRRAP
jgi:hypothetical protein